MQVKLRPFHENDLPVLVALANNSKIAMNMRDLFPHPYTEEYGRKFINKALADTPLQVMAIEADGALAGAAGIFPQDDIYRNNAELGYWVGEPLWGKGVATEAVRQMVQYAFENFQITRIYAVPFGRNVASQKVLEHNGFVLEGKFEKTLIKSGVLEDELVYGFRKSDGQKQD